MCKESIDEETTRQHDKVSSHAPQEGPPDLGLTDAAAVGKEVCSWRWKCRMVEVSATFKNSLHSLVLVHSLFQIGRLH